MKDFEDKFLYPINDANSTIGSPIGVSKQDNSSDHSSSFTSYFSVTMQVIGYDTTSMEEQLAKMARAIDKLTKIVEEKYLLIVSLMNKVETQMQNTINSSQGLTHPLRTASPSDAPHASKSMQISRQIIKFASVALLFIQ